MGKLRGKKGRRFGTGHWPQLSLLAPNQASQAWLAPDQESPTRSQAAQRAVPLLEHVDYDIRHMAVLMLLALGRHAKAYEEEISAVLAHKDVRVKNSAMLVLSALGFHAKHTEYLFSMRHMSVARKKQALRALSDERDLVLQDLKS